VDIDRVIGKEDKVMSVFIVVVGAAAMTSGLLYLYDKL